MSFSLIPNYCFGKLTEITPTFLKELGVRFLMIDLDNTIAAYGERVPSETVLSWITSVKSSGIDLCIISNSKRLGRVEAFAESIGANFIESARKPSPKALLKAMAAKGISASESSFIGDQIFTDTLAANRAGAISIIVRPLNLKNPLLFLRFALEKPFRAMRGKNRFHTVGTNTL